MIFQFLGNERRDESPRRHIDACHTSARDALPRHLERAARFADRQRRGRADHRAERQRRGRRRGRPGMATMFLATALLVTLVSLAGYLIASVREVEGVAEAA